MPEEAFLINPPKRVHRKTKRKASVKKRRVSARRKRNPMGYGKEVVVVGRNPRRRKRRASKRRVVSRRRRRNPVMSTRRTRRVYRKRRNPVARVSRKRRMSRRSYRRNPVARRRRSYRRNPAASMTMGGINLKKPMTLLMPVFATVGGVVAVKKVPDMLGLTGYMRYGAQVAVSVGGFMIGKKFVGKQNAAFFMVAGLSAMTLDILKDKLPQFFAGIDNGMGAFVSYRQPSYLGMPAYPASSSGMGAFVDQVGGDYFPESL